MNEYAKNSSKGMLGKRGPDSKEKKLFEKQVGRWEQTGAGFKGEEAEGKRRDH